VASSGGAGSGGAGGAGTGGTSSEPATIQLMQEVVFFDGYAGVDQEPLPTGIVRIDNSRITTRLESAALAVIQPHLELEVRIGALCDNYDRIGSVSLVLAPKDAPSYDPASTPRIEIARFITPFMDKNAQPDVVPYVWQADHVASILSSEELRATYDFWFELSVFGVPYAANEEVAGCAGRSDVFRGWLSLHTDSTRTAPAVDVLIPLATSEPFNDYQAGASDTLGSTKKTIDVSLDEDLAEVQVVFIISNHGANSGGEEYNRREHAVYLDGLQVLDFVPGRPSCEPFREYNTQPNGIYGSAPRSDSDWQSFSNWCPGDVIDTRVVSWGSVSAGQHAFAIDVPDAVFVGDEGNFPLSVFLIGQRPE